MVSSEATQSIMRLMRAVQDCNNLAVRSLLQAYFDKLVHLASRRF
jgi:hypothetical protein